MTEEWVTLYYTKVRAIYHCKNQMYLTFKPKKQHNEAKTGLVSSKQS